MMSVLTVVVLIGLQGFPDLHAKAVMAAEQQEELKGGSLIATAVKGVADMMNLDGLVPDMKASVFANIRGANEDGGAVTLNQPIMLDGKVITTLVSQIQYSQGQARLRNLGTT